MIYDEESERLRVLTKLIKNAKNIAWCEGRDAAAKKIEEKGCPNFDGLNCALRLRTLKSPYEDEK